MENDKKGWLNSQLMRLEEVYKSGNLGAYRDTVYFCSKYNLPLPDWATKAAIHHFDVLIKKDHQEMKRYGKWLVDYKQAMKDYSCYCDIEEARENNLKLDGVARKNIPGAYDFAEMTRKPDKKYHSQDAAKKARERVKKRMKENPCQYYQLRTIRLSGSPVDTKTIVDFIANVKKTSK